MSNKLTDIVRRVLAEDIGFRGFDMSVQAAKGSYGYRSAAAAAEDAAEDAEAVIGQPISVTGAGKSNSLLGSVKPNWGGGYATGADGHRKRPFGNWESDNAWDVFAKPGTSVYSLTKGTVSFVKPAPPGNTKVYGDMIEVRGDGGDADMYYTHVKSSVQRGSRVEPGDLIGVILDPATAGSSAGMPPHVHIGMNDGTYVANKADPSKSRGGGNLSRYVKEDGTILSAMAEEPVASGEDETPSTG